ncbi:MAG: DUF3810 domain-containing protein [Clostridiales bacterium]|jgi:hypothetical protein|nr:DUF3810 domain-containing protein [Clostridiales bacterium]
MKKFRHTVIATCIGILLCGISILLYIFTRNYPDFIDKYYSRNLYGILSFPGKLLGHILPVSVGEIILYGLIIFMLIYTVKRLVLLFRHFNKQSWLLLFRCLLVWVCIVVYAVSIFLLCGGLNYNRTTFANLSGLQIKESSVEELKELCIDLSEKASHARKDLAEDDNGVIKTDMSIWEIRNEADLGYKSLKSRYPFLSPTGVQDFYPAPKPAILSRVMCYEYITGIFPYIIPEPVFNFETPISSLPLTICHEQAHQRGFAREDEANFIAYLACVNNSDPLFQYSGYYTALSYSMNELYYYNQDYWSEVNNSLDKGITRDMDAENKFWAQFESPVEAVATSVNDTFLQANNQKDGVYSYNRIVDLLLAERRAEN